MAEESLVASRVGLSLSCEASEGANAFYLASFHRRCVKKKMV